MTQATMEIEVLIERLDRQETLLREIREAVLALRDRERSAIYEFDEDFMEE